jgi:hypothetical protein
MNRKELKDYCEEELKAYSLFKSNKRMSAYKEVLELLDENNILNKRLLRFQRLLIVCVEMLKGSNINPDVSIDSKALKKAEHKYLSIESFLTGDVKLRVLDENSYHHL